MNSNPRQLQLVEEVRARQSTSVEQLAEILGVTLQTVRRDIQKLADAGYVVASINYRVAPTATFPQPLEDVKSAIRYLKANADKFGIDARRVGIVGGSAGGYLSAMAYKGL